ncbi:MAG: hypothetical protein KGI33_05720 [Thaumarchaeota archaeon]|nr:hypothetical protein [Nitrososphaerota archaeon]
MTEVNKKQVSLNENEIKSLIAILKFAEEACPVESIDQDFAINPEKIEALIVKLQGA